MIICFSESCRLVLGVDDDSHDVVLTVGTWNTISGGASHVCEFWFPDSISLLHCFRDIVIDGQSLEDAEAWLFRDFVGDAHILEALHRVLGDTLLNMIIVIHTLGSLIKVLAMTVSVAVCWVFVIVEDEPLGFPRQGLRVSQGFGTWPLQTN